MDLSNKAKGRLTAAIGRKQEAEEVIAAIEAESGGGAALPAGGTTGQVLSKASNTDGDVEWSNSSGGATAFTDLSGFPSVSMGTQAELVATEGGRNANVTIVAQTSALIRHSVDDGEGGAAEISIGSDGGDSIIDISADQVTINGTSYQETIDGKLDILETNAGMINALATTTAVDGTYVNVYLDPDGITSTVPNHTLQVYRPGINGGSTGYTCYLNGDGDGIFAITADEVTVNGSPIGGVSTFAALQDLTTAVVPDANLTSDTNFFINSVSGNLYSALEITNTSAQFFASDASSPNTQTYLYLDKDGMMEQKGAIKKQTKYYTTEVALEAGFAVHVYSANPLSNIAINNTICHNNFEVINNCGQSLTFEAASSETFNDSPTIVIPHGGAAKFLAPANSGQYYVTHSGSVAGNTMAGLTDLANVILPTDFYMERTTGTSPLLTADIYVNAFGGTVAAAAIEAYDDDNASASIECRVDDQGVATIGLYGAFNFASNQYNTGDTELHGGNYHQIISGPVTLEVHQSKHGFMFFLYNQSGEDCTLDGTASGTLISGASTKLIPADTAWIFVKGNGAQYRAAELT